MLDHYGEGLKYCKGLMLNSNLDVNFNGAFYPLNILLDVIA